MKQGMGSERAERHRGRTEGRGAGEERRTKEKPPTTGGSARGEERGARSVRERLGQQLKRPAQLVVWPLIVKPREPLRPRLVTPALQVPHNRFAVLAVSRPVHRHRYTGVVVRVRFQIQVPSANGDAGKPVPVSLDDLNAASKAAGCCSRGGGWCWGCLGLHGFVWFGVVLCLSAAPTETLGKSGLEN